MVAFQAAWRRCRRIRCSRRWAYVQLGGWRRPAAAALVEDGELGTQAIARVDRRRADPGHQGGRLNEEEWTWVLAHCLLHLGFGHLAPGGRLDDPRAASVACYGVTGSSGR